MPYRRVLPERLFTCMKCGDCCKGYGGTYVTPADIRAIAAYVRMDVGDFTQNCCQASGSRWVIAVGDDGYCVFWDDICTIHPVKPRMCRSWPFIPSVLAGVENWHMMAGSCPGMRTDLPDSVILDCVKREIQRRA